MPVNQDKRPDLSATFLKAYDELADAIFRHCYYRVYDREQARDLCQECFTRTWEQLASGKEIHNLKAFLYRVANNLVIDRARKKKESSLDEALEQGFQPAGTGNAETAAEIGQALRAVEQLEPKYREAVRLRYIDGLSPGEIAEVTGESENNVSVRVHRGLERLRKILHSDNQ